MAGKILIIDDDRDITQIIRILLEGEGFETCTAYSGAQALASLDETVELIILDIMMDGMNGFEACHRIRESSYVPILFLSAMSGDSEKVAALMAGGDDYLCKPFSAAELTARVRSLLRRYRVYQGADRAEPERERLVLGMDNKVTVNGRAIRLSYTEYEILHLFLSSTGARCCPFRISMRPSGPSRTAMPPTTSSWCTSSRSGTRSRRTASIPPF